MADKTVIATAPPPPSEVKIRTMRSDIDSMMKSGGGAPSFQNVSVQGLSLDTKRKSPVTSVRTPMPVAALVEAAAQSPAMIPAVASQSSAAKPASPASSPASRAETPATAGSGSNFIPILIVIVVAVIALAVVGYFAYTIFK
jgi:cobalamin biosynthesis Mg chelatase CobN